MSSFIGGQVTAGKLILFYMVKPALWELRALCGAADNTGG